ncbi:response regulator [Sabulicella rubraurantiaca]|uniref:response regulator n=1 Tax=Sabulicella rubraurantiaca TaxID=2811429 RepID=UPI0022A877CA|nr:response regulator [Sabulicella rubraurantiaca]
MSQAEAIAGRNILVVEDEYLIARDLAEQLEMAGANVLGPVATVDAAMRILDRHERVDAAVLDVKLMGATVYPVADALRRLGVPILFATGYNRDALAPAFQDVLLCEKPLETSRVIHILCEQFEHSSSA